MYSFHYTEPTVATILYTAVIRTESGSFSLKHPLQTIGQKLVAIKCAFCQGRNVLQYSMHFSVIISQPIMQFQFFQIINPKMLL